MTDDHTATHDHTAPPAPRRRRDAAYRPLRAAAAAAACAAALGAFASTAAADSAAFNQPALDRWMYPFSPTGSGGARGTASTFGAVGNAGFDNRDAQFLIGFNTASLVPAGLGSGSYAVTSARMTIVDGQGTYAYDGTYDAVASYQTGAPDDAGRPLELHGVGFRNGFNRLGLDPADPSAQAFKEGTTFSPTAQPASASRSAYPLGFDATGNPRDVSNNIADGFESAPWAVGAATGLTAGASVPANTAFTFDLNVADPNVQSYLRDALNAGVLGLTVTSLHGSNQQDPGGIPQFYNKENALAAALPVAPRLELEYTVVPEPASASLLAAAAAGLLLRRRRRA